MDVPQAHLQLEAACRVSGEEHPYCTAVHGKIGLRTGLTQEDVTALVEGGLPSDRRLRHLAVATRRILGKRGWLSEADLSEFASWGIDRGQVYEIIALAAIKSISNYVNHIAHTEVDPQFK